MKRREKKSRNFNDNKIENKTINYLKIIKHLSKLNEDENKNISSTQSKVNLKSLNEGKAIPYKTKDYQTHFKKFKILQNPKKSSVDGNKQNNNTDYLQRSGEMTKKKKLIFQEYLSLTNKVKKMKKLLFGNSQNEKSFSINSNFIEMNNQNNNNCVNNYINQNISKKNIKNIIKSRYTKYRSKYIALRNDISNTNDKNPKNKNGFSPKNENNDTNFNNKDESNKELSLVKNYQKRTINSNKNNNKIRKYTTDNKTVIKKKVNYNINENKGHINKKSISNSRNKITNIFNYLVRTYDNLNLSKTFNKIDKRSHSNSRKRKVENNKSLAISKTLNSSKVKNIPSIKKNNSITLIIKKCEKGKTKKNNASYNEILKHPSEVKREKKNQILKLKNIFIISPKNNNNNTISYNNINNRSSHYTKKSSNISSNKIINNNTFNTVYNIYKINSTIAKDDYIPKYKEKVYKIQPQKSMNNTTNNKKVRKLKKNEKLKFVDLSNNLDQNKAKPLNKSKEIILNKNRIITRIVSTVEILYLLESKYNSISSKINNYEMCYKECYDWIFCYFENNIYDKIINLFNNSRNKLNITNKIKIEILCHFLCYDSCFSKNFSQAGILLKTIFHLLHNNFLLLILYKLNNNYLVNNENNYYNNYLCHNLKIIINEKLKMNLSLQELQNENCIMEIIEQNYNHINNYYKMLVDNLYNEISNFSTLSSINNLNEIKDNKIYKFPQCLSLNFEQINNNQKLIISSLFFIDAYKLLNNYNILNLKKFFDLFLSKDKYFNNSNNNYILTSYQKNKKNYNKINYSFKYLLSPIKSCYKYSLLINLNILLYYKEININYMGRVNSFNKNINENKKVILRPGLIGFLEEMKDIYELILFSNNTLEYIHRLLKYIENGDKYFRNILSNNQFNFNKDGAIKDLNSLGRNIKRIIIIDKEQNIFKLSTENENIIYVKPFYGDVSNDRNILNNLIDLLKKIRYEIEDNDNIKLSIKKHKLDIFTKISTQLI